MSKARMSCWDIGGSHAGVASAAFPHFNLPKGFGLLKNVPVGKSTGNSLSNVEL